LFIEAKIESSFQYVIMGHWSQNGSKWVTEAKMGHLSQNGSLKPK
jgi:phosphoserine aminotransferase